MIRPTPRSRRLRRGRPAAAVTKILFRPLCLALALALPITGCRSDRVPVTEIGDAHRLLEATLQAWGDGESCDHQRTRQPPVYVADDWWTSGYSLRGFEVEDTGEQVGTNVRFRVRLDGLTADGQPVSRSVSYLVTTVPAQTIAREDR